MALRGVLGDSFLPLPRALPGATSGGEDATVRLPEDVPLGDAEFRAAWNASREAMVLSNAAGIVVDANPAYLRLYDLAASAVIGKSFAVVFAQERRPWAEAQYQALFSGTRAPFVAELPVQTAKGAARTVEVSTSFLTRYNGEVLAFSIVRDVTVRQRRDDEHKDLERQKDEFLTAAAHDLNNPLTAIKGYQQLLRRRLERDAGSVDPFLLNGLIQIEDSVRQMAFLIQELLDLGRLRLGERMILQRQLTDLVHITTRAVAAAQPEHDHDRIVLRANPQAIVGYWDADRLERLLHNLLNNAVKYSPNDAAISVSLGLDSEDNGDWAVIAVQDTGIGIPAADLPHIFERFHRGGNVLEHYQGTGIGLASVKQTAEEHGGTISIASVEGVGTTVTVRLPLAQPATMP
ncbi:MAG TPA: PAS domain-containing sensor histidine kinase [Chloroflexota bacterium]|jgi:PAS domain S-box-containing protein